jgi:hypothetical protein
VDTEWTVQKAHPYLYFIKWMWVLIRCQGPNRIASMQIWIMDRHELGHDEADY